MPPVWSRCWRSAAFILLFWGCAWCALSSLTFSFGAHLSDEYYLTELNRGRATFAPIHIVAFIEGVGNRVQSYVRSQFYSLCHGMVVLAAATGLFILAAASRRPQSSWWARVSLGLQALGIGLQGWAIAGLSLHIDAVNEVRTRFLSQARDQWLPSGALPHPCYSYDEFDRCVWNSVGIASDLLSSISIPCRHSIGLMIAGGVLLGIVSFFPTKRPD